MKENKMLEFKEKVSSSFLKTVSAYANYNSGSIVFGIDSNGKVNRIEDFDEECLKIENSINDNIKPIPSFSIVPDYEKGAITLQVEEGRNKPYYYKSKAYKRSDTASIEVDRIELNRLILEGQNISFDKTNSRKGDLRFSILENFVSKAIGIESLSKDIFITLELFDKNKGYNVAAELLADENTFSGLDIVRFGDNINVFLDRHLAERKSILKQYEEAIEKYRLYYQYEEIVGNVRNIVEKIPEKAFREAIANALVHRSWDVDANIKVAMYDDRIEIMSPGGLIAGLSREEYIAGQISILRNPIVGNMFYRLKIIERFGTGIQRIIEEYKNNYSKPQFHTFDNSIKIILPIIDKELNNLNVDEQEIYKLLEHKELSTGEIAKSVAFGKTKIRLILNRLEGKGYVSKIGNGRGTKYKRSL